MFIFLTVNKCIDSEHKELEEVIMLLDQGTIDFTETETFVKEPDFAGANLPSRLVETKKVAGFSCMPETFNLLCFGCLASK